MKVGLVLSGGMAKGAYQVGALRALETFIPREDIVCVSGASVGALNGYAYATGALEPLETMWKTICSDDTRLLISQLLRSSLLQHNIKAIYSPERPLQTPFYCTLLDVPHRSVVYKDLSTVDPAQIPTFLKASVAMPIYNHAVSVGNTSYFDGAMVDNIPVYPLLDKDLDLVICMYFDDTYYRFESVSFDRKVVKLNFPCGSRLKQSLFFQRSSIEEMIDEGYERTTYLLGSIFSKGYEDRDNIYRMIRLADRSGPTTLRLTGDVLVSNLNKVTQKLTKRKVI